MALNRRYKTGVTTTSLLTIILLLALAIITVITLFFQSKEETGNSIVHDIGKLVTIFERIDKECGIVSFDYQKNPINFLTIKKGGFVGSEVGSMNLARPERWNGPYLADNPTIQEKEYQVVHTRNGYFITPGQGVRLPNNKVIGVDIILDEQADIYAMMQNPEQLMFEDFSLAAPFLRGSPREVADTVLAQELV